MQKEIYIIRHGETDYNKRGIIQGRGVNSSINDKGIRQAKAFYETFKHIQFDVIYSSSLLRTQQTLEPFANNGYQINKHEGLDEINWGVHEGKLADTKLSNEYKTITSNWKRGDLELKIPGGESPLDLQQRQKIFIKNQLEKGSENKVLICCHGRAIRILLCTLLDVGLESMDDFPHQNLSLYKVVYNKPSYEVDRFNYTDHLASI